MDIFSFKSIVRILEPSGVKNAILVVPSGCLWARAVLHPPPIGISCFFSSFFSRRKRFCGPMAMLRNGLLRYILYTCPNLWCNPCFKCYGMDCFGTYCTHAQTCDVTRVLSLEAHGTHWLESTCLWKFKGRPFVALASKERRFARPQASETWLFRVYRGWKTTNYVGIIVNQ